MIMQESKKAKQVDDYAKYGPNNPEPVELRDEDPNDFDTSALHAVNEYINKKN
jgi:hypothetical protein